MRRPPGDEFLARPRRLRRDQTEPEARLWNYLRNRGVAHSKFRRQVWLGAFIVDFLCAEAKLVVELDGMTHTSAEAQAYDQSRTAQLGALGYRVIRFWNDDVMHNIEGVLQQIEIALRDPSPSHAAHGPLPLPQRGEGI